MIIDAHAHVSPTTYGATEKYLEVLKQSGIDQAVICPGGMLDVRKMSEFVSGQKKPDTVPKNDYVARCVVSSPSLLGMACVDPTDPRAAEKLEELLEQGFRGLMVSPLVHKFSFPDEAMADLAWLCGEHDVPVISHNGWRPGANTVDYVQLARRFPGTNFILEHMGALPVDVEAADAAAELDNLFLETSLSSYLHLAGTVKKTGASKVLFGSEYPLSHPALELRKIFLLPLTDDERERILGGNIRGLLRLD
ncbi:amidohydrolase family protein [Pyxidicoccus fallax]|uniref:Amidohydrolase family protein n=1 Tax=Pyxidicoccus fallax TaxID=394095 RepID=A0A848LFX5_9BACT|nr:amidohydrolase family protein [Pyxidicoccus fallax]NMO15935.1 amidohydrolase family protein [Pyxidicoccus fallax]NPC79331.1 amidohydrolase family protein [Pyxidicoccus fallax]